jgi:NAD(P)H-flavin reductase
VGFGSRIAPARSILRDRATRVPGGRPVLVLHGARTRAGLYLDEELAHLVRKDPAVRYVGAAEDVDGCTLVDRFGEFLEASPPSQVLLAGSFPAVRAGADALLRAGVSEDAILSDML